MKKILDFFTSKKAMTPTVFADLIKGLTGQQIDEFSAYSGSVPYVSACVDAVARDVSGQEVFFTTSDGKTQEVRRIDKKITEPIFSNTNGLSFDQKLSFIVSQLKLYGNAYVFKWSPTAYNVTSGVIELLPVRSSYVTPQMRVNGNGIDYYEVTIEGNAYRADPSEIIHIRHTPAFNPFIGVGDLTKVRLLANGEKAIGEYLSEFFSDQKKTPKTFMVDHTPRMENDAIRMRDQLRNKLGNVFYINVGGPDNFDIINSGMLAADFKFIEQRQFDRETICAVFGVPQIVLGIPEGSNRSTSTNQIPLYFKSTINPIIKNISKAFTDQFVRDYDQSINFNIQLHASGEIDSVIKMLTNGIITPNRASEMMGESFDENDDTRSQYLVPASLVPLAFATMPQEAAGQQSQAPVKKEAKNEYDDAVEWHIKNSTIDKRFQSEYIIAALKSRRIVEEKYTKSIETYLDGMLSRVMKRLDVVKTKSIKADPESLNVSVIYSIEEEKEILKEEIRPIHTSAVQRGVADVSALLNGYVNVNLSNPFVKVAINRLGTKITGYVPKTTLTDLQKLITQAVNENITINELQDRISDKFSSFQGSRARMIARTESRAAWDAGAEVGYRELGVKKVDVVGCTMLEPDSDCGRKNIDINLISTLVFHPNHVGCIAPSEKS